MLSFDFFGLVVLVFGWVVLLGVFLGGIFMIKGLEFFFFVVKLVVVFGFLMRFLLSLFSCVNFLLICLMIGLEGE